MFVDGGIHSNNPVDYLYREAKQIWGKSEEPLLVSVGTGSAPGGHFGNGLHGIIEAMQKIVTQTERTANDFYHRQQDTMVAGNLYFRFNVTQGLVDVDLAEYQAIGKIVDATQVYLDAGETNTKLKQCITRTADLIKDHEIDRNYAGYTCKVAS